MSVVPFEYNIEKYLEATEVIDFHNEMIRRLADTLFLCSANELEFIKNTYEYVRDRISHSADIHEDLITCSASEVLEAGHGICFAKSHLLAALLRCKGIPAGFCYQKLILDDESAPELIYHGLNGVYIKELNQWIRLDARGNKEAVNAQFSLETEQLAFPIRPEKGEEDNLVVYPYPDRNVLKSMKSSKTRTNLWENLPKKLSVKVLLWDIDGTVLDFLAAEKAAIKNCFEICGLGECTDEMISRYSKINRKYWERLERGEMTKPEILVGRFEEFFESEGIVTNCAKEFNKEYQIRLGDTICFHDDAYELLKDLKGRIKQYAVTNGTKVAQDRKLKLSGLIDIFDGIFISEELGVEKPGMGFFEKVWEKIGKYSSDEVMIIGDSLTSDMQGGNNAGIICCWYNTKGIVNEKNIKIDYEIDNLQKVKEIL